MAVRAGIRPVLRAAAAVGVIGLAFHVAHGQFGLGGHGLDTFAYDWIYDGVILGCAVSCLARGMLVREERVAWLILGAGFASDAGGEIYYTLAFGNSATPPIPSFADALYLLYYPATYVALVLLVRRRVERLSPSTWLDGGIAATSVTAVVAAIAFEPILGAATHGSAAAVATNLAYPIGDVLLLVIVIGVFALSGWRPGGAWLLLGIGLGLTAVADTAYLYASAKGTYVVGGILDSLWIASALCAGFAAWRPPPPSRTLRLDRVRVLVIPGTFGLISLGVLLYGGFHHVSDVALACAAASLLVVIVRAAWTFSEYLRLLAASQRDAITDALTGIANRRSLNADLADALADGSSSPEAVLVLFDLDGFKLYNDSFGHMVGDTLLAMFGRRIKEAAGELGTAYRLGGDEFCVLLRCGREDADEYVSACAMALVADGEGFSVKASYGRADIPDEADTPTRALRLADDRMYAHKGGRRGSARHQTHEVLLGVLRERHPDLHEHVREVGRLAVAVGQDLGMNSDQLDELRRAAELHDVGKAAIPDLILNKPGPLDQHEIEFMRRHTLIGERILAAAPSMAPVAALVRSSHERWDGNGYPDRLTGTSIPLGARIIAVCDAFAAMTSNRPYAKARTAAAALQELHQGAGTQFDAEVVGSFAIAWRSQLAEAEHEVALA